MSDKNGNTGLNTAQYCDFSNNQSIRNILQISLQLPADHRKSITINYSHFHPLHFDTPRIRGHIQRRLHSVRDGLPVRQDLRQILRPQDVTQRRHR